MAGKRNHHLCWDKMERAVKLLIGVTDEVIRLIRVIHGR